MARTIRLLHVAMTLGLVLVAGIFFSLRRLKQGFDVWPPIGLVTAGFAVVQLAAVLGILLPRMPRRPADQSPDDYWMTVARGDTIIVWAMLEAAGLLSAVGYLLTGALASAATGVLAIAALALLGPARFEDQ
jgi:hypothetical protein